MGAGGVVNYNTIHCEQGVKIKNKRLWLRDADVSNHDFNQSTWLFSFFSTRRN